MKVVLVHDYLNQMGGAEKVVEVLTEIFPRSPLYTSAYVPSAVSSAFAHRDVRTTFMQHLPLMRKFFKAYLPFYAFAFESLRLPACDVVLTSSSAFAKGVRPPPGACHICYCYTPTRFLWEFDEYVARERFGGPLKAFLRQFLRPLKAWDAAAARRIDGFIAISRNVREKIRTSYGRDSEVVYPPVDVDRFRVADRIDDYFLVVSRLNAYKRIDIVIEAFNRLGLPLKVVGTGTHERHLKASARPNVEFLGAVGDERLIDLYGRCRALIFPGREDFGLTPVEANASGRPVIAYAAGGALETIDDGVNGLFFDRQTPEAVADAVKRFEGMTFDPGKVRLSAERFRTERFVREITNCVHEQRERFLDRRNT